MAIFFRPLARAWVGGMAMACLLGSADAGAADVAPPSAWARARTPSPGPAQVIGSAAAGCVAGAVPLAGPGTAAGPELVVLRPARNRAWGHPVLAAFLADLARWRHQTGEGPLLLGDAAQPRGGPMPAGHRSHMNGLDADLWLGTDRPPPWSDAWLAQPRARSAVRADGRGVDPLVFTVSVRRLIRHLAQDPRVERLFLNPVLKRALCQEAASEPGGGAAWLARVRPWWGHDSHVHVRLACPADSPSCRPGPPIPPGSGCDPSLDHWVADVTRARRVPSRPPPPPAPVLPEACAAVLQAPPLVPKDE
ncbi:penicillin-insensitive murein endopeptidase [Pararhodospirillum oryzae]|uniref:Penicillin-insensitive murein endopeptidase n=1 Tax=Pararhodospirillum oryzae TaxID=478448 RepID=A0A512H3E6_9PROT|nr:penicillin-insensitive murein endopeptidase [Pararhodospirillum oryzae]GEO79961.1 penicillin-insensitive murein endopeptidase [Pararhodospirillum oryzae]